MRTYAATASKLALLGALGVVLGTLEAKAYPTYTDGGTLGTFCSECHGDFDSGVYVSGSDGQSWGTDLMEAHKEFVNSDCNVCHKSGPKGDVALNLSLGGDGLEGISCTGCHGRPADRIGDPVDPTLCVQPGTVVGPCGDGAGLRQHHANNGVGACATCHMNDPVPAGEDALPTYYAQQGTDPLYLIPTDPCNPPPDFTELLRSPVAGLDNDGDNVYDTADPDCAPQPECADGIDNDGDGLIDGDDPGCVDATEKSATLPCDDGIDNDGDGRADFDPVTFNDTPTHAAGSGDPGCFAPGPAFYTELTSCQDGIENNFGDTDGIDFDGGASLDLDGDGQIDVCRNGPPCGPVVAPDPECAPGGSTQPWRNCEAPSCRRCGLGYELVLLLPPLLWLRGRRRRGGR